MFIPSIMIIWVRRNVVNIVYKSEEKEDDKESGRLTEKN